MKKVRTPTFFHTKMATSINALTTLALVSGGIGFSQTLYAEAASPTNDFLEEIVIVGQRASIKSAQHVKQESKQIVDAIVADDIGKLPDRSVTEALQRLPGVTIDHFVSIDDPEDKIQ